MQALFDKEQQDAIELPSTETRDAKDVPPYCPFGTRHPPLPVILGGLELWLLLTSQTLRPLNVRAVIQTSALER